MNKLKKRHSGIFLISLVLLSNASFSQRKGEKFTKVLNQQELYYKSLGYESKKIEKELEKFKNYWSTRLTENGELGYMSDTPTWAQGEDRSGSGICGIDEANWQVVGPVSFTGSAASDGQAGISHKQWQGKMEEVYVPSDQSYYIASSRHNGIWKRKASDASWTNVTADLNLPSINVNTIIANPYNEDQLFASCGLNQQFGARAYGILTSIDGGDTWTQLSSFSSEYTSVHWRLTSSLKLGQFKFRKSGEKI